jgi:tRNA threonylcarbamoyladenosine biosynthesis protein TsaB
MRVLAIDTCGGTGSIALGNVDSNAFSLLAQTELAGKTYTAQLVPAVRALLADQHSDIRSLEAVVAVNGPGSFTGIRIGVSSAKGIAEALEIPLVAVSRLAVLAWKAGAECAALDAGRGEFYFRQGEREVLLDAKGAAGRASGAVAVCETAAVRVFPGALLVDPPTAGDALRFAGSKLLAGDFADTAALEGNYLRRSDAEIFAKSAGKA